MMYVNNSSISVGNTSVSITSGDISAAQSLVKTYIVIMQSRKTLNAVIEQAKLPYTYEQLKSMVSANAVNATEIFEINVTGADPEETELCELHAGMEAFEVAMDEVRSTRPGCSTIWMRRRSSDPMTRANPSSSKTAMPQETARSSMGSARRWQAHLRDIQVARREALLPRARAVGAPHGLQRAYSVTSSSRSGAAVSSRRSLMRASRVE